MNPRSRKRPPTMIPETIRVITQYPMMSLAESPAIPRAGSAQNGWIMLVQESPHATDIAVTAGLVPMASPAGIMMEP